MNFLFIEVAFCALENAKKKKKKEKMSKNK